jgi:hypothetical protein
MRHKSFLNAVVAFSLLLSTLALAAPPPADAHTSQAPPHQPQALPPEMPVYAILPTVVNQDVIRTSADLFNGINASNYVTDTVPSGLTEWYALNPDTGDILNQYDHTGGLFAVNSSRAYTETEMTTSPTNTQICLFLASRNLFPENSVEPQYTNCRGGPTYMVKQIHLGTLMPETGDSTNSVIGELVQVPLAIDIGDTAPNFIPMGGPGGHLSLLLAGAAGTPSLDTSLPGLQGLASPMYGRLRDPAPLGLYPTVPEPVAIQRFKSMFPEEMQVDTGTPEMVYYVGFPDAPQDATMPTWTFPDATAVISGTVVSLKDTTLPGVEGFAPQVSILSPADGTVIMQNQPASIEFSISGDKGPFNYTVSYDDNLVASGVTAGGTQTLDLGVLPITEGRPEGHTLSVHAVNSYNQPGDAAVFLGAVQNVYLYLPLEFRDSSHLAAMAQPTRSLSPEVSAPAAPDATMRVGVEWVLNYHNPKSNLGLTKADAEGFYNWLGIWGWQRTFDWGNDAAWEKDWRDCTLGGIDCGLGVDRAEFTFFSGHGSPSAWYFGVSRDYSDAWAGNSRFQNVRWAAFSSCNTVRAGPYVGPGDPPLTDWFNAFQGLYMVLGFHSTMGDIAFGPQFGFNLYNPLYSLFPSMQPAIREAWVNTAFQMNAGKPAYLYAVGNFNPVNYKLPNAVAAPRPPLTGIYQFRWVWWDE